VILSVMFPSRLSSHCYPFFARFIVNASHIGGTNLIWHKGRAEHKLYLGHLGIKVSQPIENRPPGRPNKATEEELLRYEGLWVDTFRGLRDGNREIETEVPAVPSMFIKRSGPGQEQLYIEGSGKRPRIIRQPKFSTTPDEIHRWRSLVQKEQDQFEEAIMNPVPVQVPVAAIPSERLLWEALKRANTATQVRRICSLSRIWLKPRQDFPGGGFAEYWPWRRILYRDAAKFCRAKRDLRYPSRDQRKSGDYRRIEYLARVMAGLTLRLAPSTAVDILRKIKHSEECICWRCLMQIAPCYPISLARFLAEGNWLR
jgi:hypothetical protein